MRRLAASFTLLVSLLAFTAPASPQGAPETGIAFTAADWLSRDTGWHWLAVPAGGGFAKGAVPQTGETVALAPGAYDVYWVQGDLIDPVLVAAGVAVSAGGLTEVRAATGVLLETADWVAPRADGNGWFGAILPTATEFDFVNVTRTGDGLFLPFGEYDLYYENDETDLEPPIWLGTYDVEPVFGGVGLEVTDADGVIAVVRTLAGGAAEAAGLQPQDVILAADGTTFAGLTLAEAVALIRGPADTELVLSVRRGEETFDLTVVRQPVEPQRVVPANGGIRFVIPDGGPAIGPNGWWGVVYAGEEPYPEAFINWQDGGADHILLLGPAEYDVYWDPVGDVGAQLVAEDVGVYGTVVDVAVPAPQPVTPLPPKI